MRPERWNEIKDLLNEAMEQDRGERDSWLQARCGADRQLYEDAQSLLQEQENEAFLHIPDPERVADFLREHRAAAGVGRKIGKFKVTGVLGYGGMGVVYRAEQEHPQREVALKIIPAGQHASPYQLKLFRREVQSLARMQHAGIAALYEAGSAEDGQHYFAMELVQGSPLLDYANEHQLGIPQRLALFTRVCDAIHYAHQKGVIHRDIKPTNILVVEEGTEPRRHEGTKRKEASPSDPYVATSLRRSVAQPKLLDFGLAKLMEPDSATVSTALGKVHGTLSYMSPEQARGSSSDIDVRSDVYSLGVVLFELLTQRRPFDLAHRTVTQAIDIICREVPLKAGTILPALRGDLETIIAKAMEKEPQRRYQSAHALAEDVERFLNKQPITARPPSAVYQFRKFAARHKLPFALATLSFLILTASAVMSTVMSIRLVRERDRALAARQKESEAREGEQHFSQFLTGVFGGLEASEDKSDLTVREVMERLDARLLTGFLRDQPEVAARLREDMASIYMSLGFSVEAKEQATAALALRRSLGGDELAVAACLHRLGWSWHNNRELEAAEAMFREALEIRRRRLGEHHVLALEGQICLAECLGHLKHFEEAERLLRQAFHSYDLLGMSESGECGFAYIIQGGVLLSNGRKVEAESAQRRALTILNRNRVSEHHWLLAGRELGLTLVQLGKFEDGLEVLQPVLEGYASLYPGDHFCLARTRTLLGRCRTGLGQFDHAEALLMQAYHDVSRLSKRGRLGAAEAQEALIDLYTRWGRDDEAAAWRDRVTAPTVTTVDGK